MTKPDKEIDSTVKARKLLDEHWNEADLIGRCWGRKNGKDKNIYAGTNITLAKGDELVSICRGISGKLRIHYFVRIRHAGLGRKIRKILETNGLGIED